MKIENKKDNAIITMVTCPKCKKTFALVIDLNTKEHTPEETPCCNTKISINLNLERR